MIFRALCNRFPITILTIIKQYNSLPLKITKNNSKKTKLVFSQMIIEQLKESPQGLVSTIKKK